MEHIYRIYDFNVFNEKTNDGSSSDDEKNVYKDTNKFIIQIFI